MIKALVSAGIVISVGLLVGCDATPSGQRQENAAQAGITTQLVTNQPIPNIGYSQMRQNLIEIETAEDKGVQTTSFIFGNFSADPVQICPSIGVPIPNTASLSNPEQATYTGSATYTTPQMDPNGVYAPSASSGTFVICVGADGKPNPVYAEGNVHTVFGPAVWNRQTHSVEMTGPASFKFTASQGR